MPEVKNPRRGLKICCATTFIFLIILLVVSVTLFFTVLKPKNPVVTAHPASLENIEIQIYPTFSLNATLALVVTVENPNYGSFKYKNTSAYVSYRGTIVAQVPIEHETVPARGKLNISTYANVTGDKLVSNPNFWQDVGTGRLDFFSLAILHGRVSLLKIFNLGATVSSSCDISVFIQTKGVESVCKSKIKI